MRRMLVALLCALLCSGLVLSGAQAAPSAYFANLMKLLDYGSITVDGTSYSEDSFTALKKGDSGVLVKAIQRRLRELDYLLDSADGSYGTNTENAVRLFQKTVSLERNGTLTFDTLKELMSDSAPYYVEGEFPVSFASYAKWNMKGKNNMTFQVQVFNAARSHTIKQVELNIIGKDRNGDVVPSALFTETVSVKIKPGETAYVPKIEIYERKKISEISCEISWVEFTDGCPAYPDIEDDYWTWEIAW